MQQKIRRVENIKTQEIGSPKKQEGRKGRRHTRAFTLTELLVVIAITAILFGLLFIPLLGGLQATRRAQSQSAAQSSVRNRLTRITREISQSAHVFDNTSSPITLPLSDPSLPVRPNLDGIVDIPTDANYANATIKLDNTGRTNLLFGKIDLLPVALQDNPTALADPTIGGGPLGGAPLRLPLAPGTKVTRYFLGLKKNYVKSNIGVVSAAYYQNRYEFTKSDTEFNPFVLYRVEFDPSDPDLVNQTTNGDATIQGDINYADFFYNINKATTTNAQGRAGNNNTYAENWKSKAEIVLDGEKMDLLLWRHKRRGDINEGSPFGTAVSFSPASVAGEVAVPDTLSSPNAETPKTIPTSYKSQYGNWTLPFTVRFQRGAGDGNPDGELAVEFYNQQSGNTSVMATRILTGSGTLSPTVGTGDNNFYVGVLPKSNKFFVKTNNITYSIDPVRGRIDTAFPPLAGQNFKPLLANGATSNPMVAGFNPLANVGELVPTLFVANTRDKRAGTSVLGVNYFINKGIESVNLLSANDSTIVTGSYVLAANTAMGEDIPTNHFGKILIVPGSEQVMGPDLVVNANSPAGTSLVPYHRAATNLGSVQKPAGADPALQRYLNRSGELDYRLDDDKFPLFGRLIFDEDQGDPTAILAGLPAKATIDAGNESTVQVTYLWQNNYARNAAGEPVNANNTALSTDIGGKPDGDTVRVDYSTRALLNINFGARVYVSDGAEPQTVQVTEKVKINNLGR